MNTQAVYFCAGAVTMAMLFLVVICVYAVIRISGDISQVERDDEI